MSYQQNQHDGVEINLKSNKSNNSYLGPSQLGYGAQVQSKSSYVSHNINQSSNQVPQGKLVYKNVAILSKKAGKVLDVCQDKQKQGMLIIYDDCNQPNQRFDIIKCGDFVLIVNNKNGKALTVAGNSEKNGAPIIQQSISGLVGQKFRLSLLDNNQYIIHTFCGKALDCCEQKTSNGTPVIQYKFDRKQHQKWIIK